MPQAGGRKRRHNNRKHYCWKSFSKENFSEAHHGLCPEICSLNWKSSDTTGNGTGLGTGRSLARRSCNVLILTQLFFLMAWLTWSKVEELMIFGVIIWQTVAAGGLLWYFHTYVGSGHFLGSKIFKFQYFWGFSEKWIFLGIKILWIFSFWIITILDYI